MFVLARKCITVGILVAGFLSLTGCPQKPVTGSVPSPPATTENQPIPRISPDVAQRNLHTFVPPLYPKEAKAKGLEGTVVLKCLITRTGTVSNLHVVSSTNPIFNEAALRAVHEWHYKPYWHNGRPVNVRTTIHVVFSLGKRERR